jgi:DNA-directed RNA polymerase subunit H (RpoH/RPB5)
MKLSVYFLIGAFFIQKSYCMEMEQLPRGISQPSLIIPLENILFYVTHKEILRETPKENDKPSQLSKVKNNPGHKEISIEITQKMLNKMNTTDSQVPQLKKSFTVKSIQRPGKKD